MAVKNMAASVLTRLKNQSKEEGIPFQMVLQLFAQEEFLRKLSLSQYADTGSKRVSVIIRDKKRRYLIAERAGVAEEPIEFPSFLCKDTRLPEGDEGITLVTEGIKEVIGIEIKDPKLIETFFDDEYPFYHSHKISAEGDLGKVDILKKLIGNAKKAEKAAAKAEKKTK